MRTDSLAAAVGVEPSLPHRRDVEELHADRGQALFGFARRLGMRDEEAADAVQETLLRLWRELDGGRPINDRAAWSFRTIYRICMDEHRLRRRVAGLRERLGGAAPRPLESAADRDERLAVWTEVDRLPERQRQVLYLRYRADLPFDDIALVLGVSPGAARTLASRALDQLRKRLRDTEEVT